MLSKDAPKKSPITLPIPTEKITLKIKEEVFQKPYLLDLVWSG